MIYKPNTIDVNVNRTARHASPAGRVVVLALIVLRSSPIYVEPDETHVSIERSGKRVKQGLVTAVLQVPLWLYSPSACRKVLQNSLVVGSV